jgi:peptidoglycan/LPS O-acetylase OafA/YrhL
MSEGAAPVRSAAAARSPGVDLARIAAMALVCLAHVLNAGGVADAAIRAGAPACAVTFLRGCAYASVDVFAIVSGYLLATSRTLRAGRLLRLYADVWFVGLLSATLAAALLPGRGLHSADWLRILLPLSHNEYWYFTAYAGMFPFVPLVAAGLGSVSGRTSLAAVLLALALCCLPSVFSCDPFVLKGGRSPAWLLVLFVLGAHLRLHVPPARRAGPLLAGFFLCAAWPAAFEALRSGSPWALRAFGPKNPFLSYLSPSVAGGAFLLVRYFVSRPFRPGGAAARIGRFLAPAAFGVYLWHTQPFVFRFRFAGSFQAIGALPWPLMALASVTAACALFLALALLEKARLALFALVWRTRRRPTA